MCTSIALVAQNEDAVHGRTMEWGTFDLNSRLVIIPRGFEFTSKLSDKENGKTWKAKYGAVGFDAINKDYLMDGMNEKGLTVSMLFHPGTAQYQKYDSEKVDQSLAPVDLVTFILTNAASIEETCKLMNDIRVVPIVEEAFGDGPAPGHLIIYDKRGDAIAVEYLKGRLHIFDASLKVMTNSPSYDWHETNLRNYVNLSPIAPPSQKIADLDFTPLGHGSGMIGLPGDFTPVSRFVRAVAWTQTARKTENGQETVYEIFRILDNFNVPLGDGEGHGKSRAEEDGLRSSTIWTVAYDKKNLIIYYHTHNNRRVRKFDMKNIDFEIINNKKLIRIPLDFIKEQDVQEIPIESFE